MGSSRNNLDCEALKLGATRASIIDVSSIPFSFEFRRLCEENKCGHYGKNWMCPPAVGSFEELQAKAAAYTRGLLFQTVHSVADSFDQKGIQKAFSRHTNTLKKIIVTMEIKCGLRDILALGAGPCTYCEKCTLLQKKPCRLPDRAVASMESYGIDVAGLVKRCGIPYSNEKNTISLVGCILFNS